MDERMKEFYGETLEKEYSKIEYRVTYKTTEVDVIIREKDE